MISSQASRERCQEAGCRRLQPAVQGRLLLPAAQGVEGVDDLPGLDVSRDGRLDGGHGYGHRLRARQRVACHGHQARHRAGRWDPRQPLDVDLIRSAAPDGPLGDDAQRSAEADVAQLPPECGAVADSGGSVRNFVCRVQDTKKGPLSWLAVNTPAFRMPGLTNCWTG